MCLEVAYLFNRFLLPRKEMDLRLIPRLIWQSIFKSFQTSTNCISMMQSFINGFKINYTATGTYKNTLKPKASSIKTAKDSILI